MFTYQIRPRTLRLSGTERPEFPADCVVRFTLRPLQPFGCLNRGGHTVVRSKSDPPAHILFDMNTGSHDAISAEPLEPLDVRIAWPDSLWRLDGNILEIRERFISPQELLAGIQSVYLAIPALLSVEFADPPYVVRVEGTIGTVAFGWELNGWTYKFMVTDQAHQEKSAKQALERISVVAKKGRRRLLAAVHYFHVACRLSRVSSTAGEFLSESLFNLSKVLEVLFPGDNSRDAARAGLQKLGLTEIEIERDYIPAMLLRNEVDVGHVQLGSFSDKELETIHSYTERAEGIFRILLERVFSGIQSGDYEVAEYDLQRASDNARRVVMRMAQAAED